MWKLGNIDLVEFGLTPSAVEGSNLPISGCFDMPARIGKVGHDWGNDEVGLEAYVREEEIRLGGRGILFVGFLKASNEKEALQRCYELYKQLGASTTLVDFVADKYGTFQVYIKDEITAEYAGDGCCRIKIAMREPVVQFTSELAVPSNAELGIDGCSFADLGLIVLDVTGRFNNPRHKEFKVTDYETEGFKITPTENREVTVKALMDCPNIEVFKSRLNKIYNLFKKEGVRYITYRNDAFRIFFVKEGVQVSSVMETDSQGRIVAVLMMKFVEVEALQDSDWGFLLSHNADELTDLLGEKIAVIPETNDESEEELFLGLSNFVVDAASSGGEYIIQVTTNTSYVLLENSSWIELGDSAGVGNGIIRIEVEAYAGLDVREAVVTLQSPAGTKKITVRQGVAYVLTVDKTVLNVLPAGGSSNLVIQSNTNWTITENASWLSVSPNSGSGNATVVVTVLQGVMDRTAPVNITGGNITRTVNVHQGNEAVGEDSGILADFPLPVETHWNNFRPDAIPDFEIPKRTDDNLPVKGIIWHAPYRNVFGSTAIEQLTKMFAKGIVAINATKLPPYYAGMENLVTGDRIVMDAGLGTNPNGNKESAELSYEAFANFAKTCFGYANTYHIPKDSQGRYRVFLAIVDYENYYTKLSNQEDANYHVVAFDAGLSQMTGRYAFQYALGLHGTYATHDFFARINKSAWNLPVDTSVPVALRGKSLASNPRNAAVFEVAFTFETFLPQGRQTKDQHGNNWITINHFGGEANNTYGYNTTPNAEHWAAQIDMVGAVCFEHRQYGQDVIVQIKPVNERDNGFHYSDVHPEYADGKWIEEYNRYGIVYEQPIYDMNGNQIGKFEAKNALGSEYLPNFIAEGQLYLSYFDGVRWANWWSSAFGEVAVPRPKVGNERRGNRYDDATFGNADLENYTYTMRGGYLLDKKITIKGGGGLKYSFYDICVGGDEDYLWNRTKIIYPDSPTIRQYSGDDWQKYKKTAARAVKNSTLRVVFLLAFQPYGCEDSQITFVFDEDGANIRDLVDVPVGKFVIKAYSYDAGIAIDPPTSVDAPVIVSSPSPMVAGTFATLSANAGTGAISWFKNGASAGSGNSLTVNVPVEGDVYTAKRTVLGVVSAVSNSVTVQAVAAGGSGVTITLPSNPLSYFMGGHDAAYYNNRANKPAIFTNGNNGNFEMGDVVKMKNADMEIWIDLKAGGQICFASVGNTNKNVVFLGYDKGVEWQADYTQYLVGGQIEGQTSGSPQNNTDYNTTQGGSYLNQAVWLSNCYQTTDGFYTKVRPLLYPFNGLVAEVEIETTYKLIGSLLKVQYKYTSFRTDSHVETGNPFRFKGFVLPVMFCLEEFSRYAAYEGDSPWSGGSLREGDIPNATNGASPSLNISSTERWGMIYDPNTSDAIGVYNDTMAGNASSIVFEQMNKYAGNPSGNNTTGARTIMSMSESVVVPDGHNYVHESTAYITLGKKSEIRQRFGAIRA